MVDFRKWFPALAAFAVLVGTASSASAQTAPALTCVANAGATPLVRAEGLTELVGDVTIICQGGTPTAAGALVPQVNIQIFLNTNVTSRLVADPLSEALILIDDPTRAQQRPCVPTSGTNCPILGVGGGNGVDYRTSGVPNVFQARNGGPASLTWLGVPIDPPGSNATRIIRITNVRANANALGTSSTLIPTQITMYISITPFQALPLNNPQQTVAYITNGLTTSVRNAANDATITSGVTFLQCVSNNTNIAGDPTRALQEGVTEFIRFTEGFASSFKRRNVAPFGPDAPGATFSADVSPNPLPQDTPGGLCPTCVGGQYFTETGFYNPAFTTTNGLNRAGLADHGTRLMVRFAGVPAGAQVFVGLYERNATASTSRVRLISTDANGAGAFTAVAATSTSPFSEAPVTLTTGAGVAVYEVMNADPLAVESIDIPISVAFTSNTTNNTPALGTATVTGSFAPLSTVTTQSATAPIPRFADTPTTRTAFVINACSTNLLFPFVTNQAGFDTGIAISNTSLDPFRTPTQQGACIINYYGSTTTGPAPAATTSGVVRAGETLTFLLSSNAGLSAGAAGFQGYIIAQCAFQFGHGFAFISDLGGNRLAEGYLALVMDGTAPTVPRSKTVSEPLGH